jgi:hypothetical protein
MNINTITKPNYNVYCFYGRRNSPNLLQQGKITRIIFYESHFLPPCPVKRFDYSWRNTGDFPRNWCILDFIDWIKKYNIENINHLGYPNGIGHVVQNIGV